MACDGLLSFIITPGITEYEDEEEKLQIQIQSEYGEHSGFRLCKNHH